jgi:opacity protein-like surface antigen
MGFTQSGGGVTRSTLGADLGARIGFLKVFVGYDFLNDWDFKATGTQTNDLTLHGTGLHAGLGMRLFSRIHLNAEYRLSTFTKYSQGGDFDLNSDNTLESGTASSFMFTLSCPLRL